MRTRLFSNKIPKALPGASLAFVLVASLGPGCSLEGDPSDDDDGSGGSGASAGLGTGGGAGVGGAAGSMTGGSGGTAGSSVGGAGGQMTGGASGAGGALGAGAGGVGPAGSAGAAATAGGGAAGASAGGGAGAGAGTGGSATAGTGGGPTGFYQMEDLDRGVVAVVVQGGVYVGWRMFGYEYDTATGAVSYNLYRDGALVTNVTDSTNYLDSAGQQGSSYTVRAVIGGAEGGGIL